MNKVTVFISDKRFRGSETQIRRSITHALKMLKKDTCEVSVFLVTDQKIRFLNKKFRRRNTTTTVLSFEEPKIFTPRFNRRSKLVRWPHPESTYTPLGEIYLAPDHIRREKEDIRFLVVHGLLHLLGYTHKRKGDRMKMEREERKLL